MKSILEIIISFLIGVLVINFPISICSQSQSQSQDKLPTVPIPPQAPTCTGFPGSAEWTSCFQNFQSQMHTFAQQMQALHGQVGNGTANNDGATSSVLLNGYSVRGKGVNINSNSANGQVNIQVFIGKPDNISVNATEHQINWDLTYPQNVTTWLVLKPPQNVNITSIKHEVKNDTILISGPTDFGGSSSSSSSSGFVSNYAGAFNLFG